MSRLLPTRPAVSGQFDVVVIGGGINGVAIGRECASAGRRTLLLERHDLASGTTSRSTRIIHGGLRYLQFGEIGLVRESLRERERLLRERPHLVRPMSFVLALGRERTLSALEIRSGLWFYRRFAGMHSPSADTIHELREFEKQLDAGQHWSLFHYDDAQCEFPERLVAEWLIEAAADGAVIRNYTAALGVRLAHGRVLGVIVRDLLTNEEFTVDARWIINATGPWADHICGDSGIDTAGPMIGGVRGSHLVLPQFPGMPGSAVYTHANDGRAIFVIPWNGQVLLGTTEIRDSSNPSGVQPAPEEIRYLLDSINNLFPNARITEDKVLYAFAGVRPLPYVPDKAPNAITRRHLLRNHAADGAAGLISVIGGKLTTAASLARQCAHAIGIKVAETPLPIACIGTASGLESTISQWSTLVAQTAGITEQSARAMAAWHGRRAFCVARLAGTEPQLARPLFDSTEHIVAEAVSAVRYEYAVTLADILLRRVPVALSGSWNEHSSRVAAKRIGAALRWERDEIEYQLEEFENERNAFLRKPARPGNARSTLPSNRAA
ncbi:MAG TPA: glycerol-3-phosphate dehydrogenase/oxidase [Clostridia bacterium]|nr:glycerol-3-phosphate dehydrogenase/oxidase [Clostridia bacterium]